MVDLAFSIETYFADNIGWKRALLCDGTHEGRCASDLARLGKQPRSKLDAVAGLGRCTTHVPGTGVTDISLPARQQTRTAYCPNHPVSLGSLAVRPSIPACKPLSTFSSDVGRRLFVYGQYYTICQPHATTHHIAHCSRFEATDLFEPVHVDVGDVDGG